LRDGEEVVRSMTLGTIGCWEGLDCRGGLLAVAVASEGNVEERAELGGLIVGERPSRASSCDREGEAVKSVWIETTCCGVSAGC
jgi:hypothetical protein